MELFLGGGSCGKTRLKKGAAFEKKKSGYEKTVVCVGIFYEMLIIVKLEVW
jgi:hypothetical protein